MPLDSTATSAVTEPGQPIQLLKQLSREAAGNWTKFASTNWTALAAKRGRLVANAVKAGCKCCFRNLAPPVLPHEKPEPTQVESSVIVGLAGLQALIDDQEFEFGSISDEEVQLATRYALHELNGFPDWLPELAQTRPRPVGEVLKDCVRGEWEYPPERVHTNDVLADLAWEGGRLASLVRDTLIDLFRKGNPANRQILEFALEALVKTSVVPDPDVASLAAERCRVELSIDADAFVLWTCVCLQFDADQGVKTLESRLKESDAPEQVMLRVCSTLSGEVRHRLPLLPQADYLRPACARRLAPLVFLFVRPADDIDRRHTGPYTPTARDQACQFRDGLLVSLLQSDAPDAAEVLRELRDRPELVERRDWITHLIDERTRKDAELAAWSPTDIRAFAADCKADPYNAALRDLARLGHCDGQRA